MIDYIVNEYGKDKIKELLLAYGDINKVLNVSDEEFESGWRKFLKNKVNI